MRPIKVKEKNIDGETWIKFNSEFDRKRYFYGNLLTVVLIIVMLILGGLLFTYMFFNVNELKANPFVYGANQMKGEVYCNCMQETEDKIYNFKFNKTAWIAVPSYNRPGV